MALDFGKLNFSTSFNPTSAFPLDARTYFESLSAAQQAAAQAVEVGGTSSKYYIGQLLTVYEHGVVKVYMIQPDGTLEAPGAQSLKVNENVFEIDDITKTLNLVGFEQAAPNTTLSKNVDGSLSWNPYIDAYSKTETETKIAAAIASASHLKRKIVKNKQEIQDYIDTHDDEEQYIFMVPTGFEYEDDKYDEYMVVTITDAEGIETQLIEKVGSWEVNLNDYAKITDVENQLNNKVDKVENARLITNEEADKLAGIEAGAQVNIINSFSPEFTVSGENKTLAIASIEVDKVSGLEELLNSKVDIKEGYGLVSPDDREKLDALVIGEGGIEISGKVNAENVQGLDEWISENAGVLPGLSENNLSNELYNKLNQSLFITKVSEELKVEANELSVNNIAQAKVTGLIDTLNSLATKNSVNTLQVKVDDISERLQTYVSKTTYEKDIQEIRDILTWKDM